jgi:hypothetical protein
MAAHGEAVLRQRLCLGCQAVFFICEHCDRGHRYCSLSCRDHARTQQRRRANRRHQQSAEGRLDHRDRQRQYRERCASSRDGSGFPFDRLPGIIRRWGGAQIRRRRAAGLAGKTARPVVALPDLWLSGPLD